MNEQSITLDLRKTGFGKRVAVRQNDYRGITLAVDVTDGGKAYSVPSSAKCCLMARLLGSYVRDGGCTVEGGRIVYTADERMFGASGTAEAYFRIEVDGAAYSTESFQLVVERAADGYAQLSEAYDTKVDQAIRDAKAAATEANDAAGGAKAAQAEADAAAKKAGGAAAKAEAWAGKVDDATASATAAAEKAETAAQQATAAANKVFPAADNVLTGSASGAVAHAEDAFAGGALRGITVEGACRQDGTPTPDAPVPIEVVETPVVTVAGRNLLDFGFPAYEAAYAGGVAVIRTDYVREKTVTLPFTSAASSAGFGFAQRLAAGEYVLKAFNLPSGKHAVNIAGYAAESDIWDKGRAVWFKTETSLGSPVRFTVQEGGELVVFCFAAKWDDGTNKVTYPADFKASVELAEPLEYRPYSPQARAFALPAEHPYLAKLPDGTADTIEVDAEGNVELVARVDVVNPDGLSFSIKKSTSGRKYIEALAAGHIAYNGGSLPDSKKTCMSPVGIGNPYTDDAGGMWLFTTSASQNALIRLKLNDALASIEDGTELLKAAAEWIASTGLAYYQPLMTPVRYTLAPIEMPKAQDGIINAWTDAEAAPSTSIRYIRDVNTVVANLESAIASIS